MRYDINAFRIGDYLYSWVTGGVHAYRVIEIRTREGEKNQLVVEDQSCNHGWKCRLVVHQDPVGNLARNVMLNDEDDSQGYWHTQGRYDYYLHPTLLKARQECYRRNIAIIKEEIAQLEARLARERVTLAQYMEVVNAQELDVAPRG